jgi:hypothetical protein
MYTELLALWTLLAAAPAAEDCLGYSPAKLRLVDGGSAIWRLRDGEHDVLSLGSREDGERALAVARRHTAVCFVGRSASGPKKSAVAVTHYWTGSSGIRTEIGDEDCVGYDKAALVLKQRGLQWRITSGRHLLMALDSEDDARRAYDVAKGFDQHCFIGRSLKLPWAQKRSYIVSYWK